MTSKANHFPQDVLKRFLVYLEDFKDAQPGQEITVAEMVRRYGVDERQIRRELAALTGSGELRDKYPLALLVSEMEYFLGYHNLADAALVGFGRIGRALLRNSGFAKNGLTISAVFDPEVEADTPKEETGALPMSKIPDLFERLHIHLGIVAVPPAHAQSAADALVQAGALAIWNLSGTPVAVPDRVLVESETFGEDEDVAGNEHVALSLVVLSKHLAKRMGWK